MTHSDHPIIDILSPTFVSRADLRARGFTRSLLARALADGRLVRLRRDRYVGADTPAELVSCGRLGGRLHCVSLLARIGVFVRDARGVHLQFSPATTRLPPRPPGTAAHWRHTAAPPAGLTTTLVEALTQACRCQSPRDAVATLDSAWHLGLVDEDDLAEIFRRLPRRYQVLRRLLEPRSESGPESIVRLILRSLGAHVDVQVRIPGVGRVDLVVDGWLIVECDSRAYHEGWDAQRRDRRRDIAAARQGYTTIRPLAEDVLFDTDTVRAALAEILRHGPRDAAPTAAAPATRQHLHRTGA